MLKVLSVKFWLLCLILNWLLISGAITSVKAQSANRPEYLPDEVLVKFKDGVPQDTVDTIIAGAGGAVVKKFRLIPALRLKIPAGTVESAISLLKRFPEIEYVEPNYLRYLNAIPNDPD